MRHFARKLLRSLCFVLLVASPVVAGPVLHEKLAPNPVEDMRFRATTPSGQLPAAMQTRSGVVSAPDEAQRQSQVLSHAYGGSMTPSSADANYHLDKLTTRPDRVQYDEPFRPSVLPFKRLYAFDSLEEDMSFSVGNKALSVLSVGGIADESEDVFFADFEVDLVAEVPVRIPSLGPGARIRALHVDPPRPVEILEDGAENWFARSERGGRVRIVMQLSIQRSVFGAPFAPVSWTTLAPHLSKFPDSARRVSDEVLQHLELNRGGSPNRVLPVLVEYFRKFRESSELPRAVEPAQLYRELSLEQKGVCRHRAYAFAVTALALGFPTRLVHNEAHAWVEVFDSEIWHRLDLGGAASNIQEMNPDPLTPHHRPPRDPYPWPTGSRSALPGASRLLGRHDGLVEEGAHDQRVSKGGDSDDADLDGSVMNAPAIVSTQGNGGASNYGESAEVSLHLEKKQLLRGSPLQVRGSAVRQGRSCSLARIDILIEGSEGSVGIGSVATNRRGEFVGQVTLPQSTPVGPLHVRAVVAGGCE